MKLLQVLFSGLGGHGSVAFSLVRGDRHRVHQHAMIFYGIERLARGYAAACAELGVEHTTVTKRQGLDVRSWYEVLRTFHRYRPDALVLHSTTLMVPAIVYARTARIPLIAVDHHSTDLKALREWVATALGVTTAHRTVVLTPEFARELANRLRWLYRDEHVVVIGNGIDLTMYSPAPSPPTTAGTLRVGMHGRFSASKDYATLLVATAKVDGISLSFAGDGETLAATRALAHELDIQDRVQFHGMLPEAELPDYLRALDVYVQSSLGEAMSTSVMQAMATGLPVVASDVSGLRTMVRQGETGELFRCGDADGLAGILAKLRDDVPSRRRMGRGAFDYARGRWSHETMFHAYDTLISELNGSALGDRHGAYPRARR